MKINQLQDADLLRQQRNQTQTQRKNNSNTQEGVIVNNFIKDECNLNGTKDTLIISDEVRLPQALKEKPSREKSLLPISAIALGAMGVVTALTALVSHSAKVNFNVDKLKKLPSMTRNITLNEETQQALYRIVECPNKKTIMAGVGVFALSVMAFMGKTFFDGFKDVWTKKKEADIQKHLQDRLIDIETQTFSGKIQINRSMLSKQAYEFGKYLGSDPILTNFNGKKFDGLMFTGREDNSHKKNNLKYFLMGVGTLAGIVGLGFLSMKNLSKGKTHLDKFIGDIESRISTIASKSKSETKDVDKLNLKSLFHSIEPTKEKMRELLLKADWKKVEKESFIKEIYDEINTSTTKVHEAIGGNGTPKPSFLSFVDDYRAFLYNYLLDTKNKQFKALFLGITGLSAVGYGGKLVGDAVKDIQVKKLNADTEVELQQRLVSTELRNFKSKKEAAIRPLVEEFYKKAAEDKPKDELKTMADNILFEIKNGAPFVYS